MYVPKHLLYVVIGVSTVLFLFALSVLIVFPSIYERRLHEETRIVKNSFLYEMWIDLPLPIYQRLYFFNITNSEDFMKNGAALEVKEVGPYTYKSHWRKKDIKWNANGTVSYREAKIFNFLLEESVGSESDKIYTLNGPLIMAADFLKEKGSSIRKGADKLFRLLGEKLVIEESIGNLAFTGFTDPIIAISKFFRPGTPFKNGKFAWLFGRNDSDDGLFTVFTGEGDNRLLNVIDTWNGNSYLPFWKDKICNKINGTNGEFGPALRENQLEYVFFQPIFCRSMSFSYTGNTIHKEILSKRFENNAKIFNNSNPDNFCFDTDSELESGVLNVRSCQFGAPIVLSFPHFYLADSEYLDNINGLNPNRKNHSSYIDVEPLSGITVDLSIKFQLNVEMESIEYLSAFTKVTPGVYPIFWVEMSAELTDDLADIMKDKLYKLKDIAYVTVGFVVVVSFMIFVIAANRLIKIYQSPFGNSERQPLLSNRSDSCISTNSGVIKEVIADTMTKDSNHQVPNIDTYSTTREISHVAAQQSRVQTRVGTAKGYFAVKSMEISKK